MAYPPYVLTRPVSVGGSMTLEGSESLRIKVTVTSTRSLVWDDTGYRFESRPVSVTSEPGAEAALTLPRTDVAGWRDGRTGALIDVSAPDSHSHTYNALVEFLTAAGTSAGIPPVPIGPFVLPAGDGAIDLDKTVPVGTVSGQVLSVPDSWSLLVASAEQAAADARDALLSIGTPVVAPTSGSIPKRTAFGTLKTAAPVELDDAVSLAAARAGFVALPPTASYVWAGDSLSAQGGGSNAAPGSFLASLTGAQVDIDAVGGETSAGIAARLAALPLLMAPQGGAIPASGPVTVTLSSTAGEVVWPLLQTAGNPTIGKTWVGRLAGVHGTFALVQPSGASSSHQADDYYTFTRTTAGSAVPVPRPTPFLPDYALAHAGRVHILWPGRNSVATGSPNVDAMVAQVQAMVTKITAEHGDYLILGIVNGTAEGTGTSIHTNITTYNARLAALYGRRFLDIRRLLIDHGLAQAGILPTAQDTADIAADTVPASLRTDTVHLTVVGRQVVAQFVYERLQELGLEPLAAPTPPTDSAVVRDTFTAPDGSALQSHTPEKGVGPWYGGSGVLAGGKLGASASLVGRADAGVTNVAVTAEITHPSNLALLVGVSARGNMAGSSMVFAYFEGQFVKVGVIVSNGTVQSLASAAFTRTAGQTHTLRLEVAGDQVKVYAGSAEPLVATLTSQQVTDLAGLTYVGVRINAAATGVWDDFVATPIV